MRGRVEISGINTAKLPVLKNDEMTALLRRAHAGDTAAREQLICGNLRLVLSVIQRFSGRGENADDLFQVGCVGLLKAIDNFDPAQQVRFSTYGVPMIIGEIRRFLRDNNALRVSRTLRDTAYRAMQARETLEKQLGREPTMDEIAAGIQMAVAKRCFVMAKKAGATDSITLTGGCAKNAGLKQAIEHVLKLKVIDLKTDPQLMGALGAAEYARQKGMARV